MTQKTEQARKWIVDHVPLPFLTNAHETALAAVFVLLGLGLVVTEEAPESVNAQVPHFVVVGWTIFLLAGGLLTLWGLFATRPRAEWAGQTLLGWGCAFYSGAIFAAVPVEQGGVAASVFAILGAVSFWRAFKITSASLIQYRLTKAARHAHVRAITSRKKARA